MAQKTKASGSHSAIISDFAKNFSLLSSPDCSCGILHTALSVSHTSQANINSESPQSVTSTIVFSKCQSQLLLAFTKKPLTDFHKPALSICTTIPGCLNQQTTPTGSCHSSPLHCPKGSSNSFPGEPQPSSAQQERSSCPLEMPSFMLALPQQAS